MVFDSLVIDNEVWVYYDVDVGLSRLFFEGRGLFYELRVEFSGWWYLKDWDWLVECECYVVYKLDWFGCVEEGFYEV